MAESSHRKTFPALTQSKSGALTFGSKLKTLSNLKGHSKPHLHVPDVCRYFFTSSGKLRAALLGLQQKKKTNIINMTQWQFTCN